MALKLDDYHRARRPTKETLAIVKVELPDGRKAELLDVIERPEGDVWRVRVEETGKVVRYPASECKVLS